MNKKITVLCTCYLFVVPMIGFADDAEENTASTEVAEDQTISVADWRERHETAPRTNPRWQRNPEARKAYLRGEQDYRGYPRQSDQKTGRQSNYYRQGASQNKTRT